MWITQCVKSAHCRFVLDCFLFGCNNDITVLINLSARTQVNLWNVEVKSQLETSVSQKLQKVKSVYVGSLCDFTSCFSVVSLLHMASWGSSCSHTDRMWGSPAHGRRFSVSQSVCCLTIKMIFFCPQSLRERVIYPLKMRETFRYLCWRRAVNDWLINATF